MSLKLTLAIFLILECAGYILGCSPNVIGENCDKCEENYWNIRSEKGCEPCDCDPVGSKHPQCNQQSGDCDCNENFGGRRCNECKANYWGDPKDNKCIKCECNHETQQCDPKTGDCECRLGIGGDHCDQCEKGYFGDIPHCRPCGECFDKWSETLIKLEEEGKLNMNQINVTALEEFNDIQNKLNDIEKNLNQRSIDLGEVEGELDRLKELISKTEHGELKNLNEILANASSEVANTTLKKFKNKMNLLRNKTDELIVNGTKLQERNLQEDLNKIKNAKNKSDEAAKNAINTQDIVKNVATRCKDAENKLNTNKHQEDMASLNNLTELIKNLNASLPKLNKLICDGSEYPCDNICGGALCGKCGSSTCNGTKNQAENANNLSIKTEILYTDKEKLLNEYIKKINSINGTSLKNHAIFVSNQTLEAKIKASNLTDNVNNKLVEIDEFMKQSNQIPKEIQDKIEDVLEKNFKSDLKDIEEISLNIKEVANSLTNVEPIRAENEGHLNVAKKLKEDAENATKQVDDMNNTVNNIEKFLNNTKNVQIETETKIGNISKSFDDITSNLDKIDTIINGTHQHMETTSGNIKTLNKELDDLKKLLNSNLFAAKSLKDESMNITKKVEETLFKLNVSLKSYDEAKEKLNASMDRVTNTKARAENLLNKALDLELMVEAKQDGVSKLISPPKDDLSSLEEQLNQLFSDMDKHSEDIENIADYFKYCNTNANIS